MSACAKPTATLDGPHLERIDGRERHAEGGARSARKDSLDEDGELDALEESDDAGVGGRVTKARERALKEGGKKAGVEARELAVGPEGGAGVSEAATKAVL